MLSTNVFLLALCFVHGAFTTPAEPQSLSINDISHSPISTTSLTNNTISVTPPICYDATRAKPAVNAQDCMNALRTVLKMWPGRSIQITTDARYARDRNILVVPAGFQIGNCMLSFYAWTEEPFPVIGARVLDQTQELVTTCTVPEWKYSGGLTTMQGERGNLLGIKIEQEAVLDFGGLARTNGTEGDDGDNDTSEGTGGGWGVGGDPKDWSS